MLTKLFVKLNPGLRHLLELLELNLEEAIATAYASRVNLTTCRRWLASYPDLVVLIEALQYHRVSNLPIEEIRADIKKIREQDYKQRRVQEIISRIAREKVAYDTAYPHPANLVVLSVEEYALLRDSPDLCYLSEKPDGHAELMGMQVVIDRQRPCRSDKQ